MEDDLKFIDSKFEFLKNKREIEYKEKKEIKESFEPKALKKKLDISNLQINNFIRLKIGE